MKKTRLTLWLISLFCYLGGGVSSVFCQDSLSLTPSPIDTLPTTSAPASFSIKRYLQEDYPSPKKAITLAIIPGMGQIYNKKFWKLPIVYGLLGGVIYAIDRNSAGYHRYRKAYEHSQDESTHIAFCDANSTLCNTDEVILRNNRNAFDKNRQLAWIGLIGFYLISAGDAFVDAHLKDFNVNDNISWIPTLQTTPTETAALGISITIKF